MRAWFDEMLGGNERFAVPGVRVDGVPATHHEPPHLRGPTPRPEAFAFADATLAQPLHLEVGPGRRHVELLRALCEEADAVDDLIADAAIAAVAVEHGCELITLDRDFARFKSVRHKRPIAADAGSPPVRGAASEPAGSWCPCCVCGRDGR